MNEYTVAAAIATRLGATTPPSGQEAIKYASADFPDSLSLFPSLIVGVSSMSDATFQSRRRSLPLDFPVALYLAKSDGSPRRSRAVRDWITALYGRLSGQMMLGLAGTVSWSEIIAWSPGVSYAGENYDGINLTARVLVEEDSGAAA